MKKLSKLSISAISVFAVAATAVPVSTIIALRNKNDRMNLFLQNSIPTNMDVTAAVNYSLPASLTYSNLPNHFNKTEAGYLEIFNTLEKIYTDGIYDQAELLAFYINNTDKANNFIDFVNTTLRLRGFWGNLWSGIKHVASTAVGAVVHGVETVGGAISTAAVAVATGAVELTNEVSGGQLQGAVNTMENLTTDFANFTADSAVATYHEATELVKDFFGIDLEHISDSDWTKFAVSLVFLATLPLGGPIVAGVAAPIISKTIALAANVLIKSTLKDFLVWTGHKVVKLLQKFDAMSDPDIPDEIKNNLETGDHYFRVDQVMFKISVV